jgi:hypothetical protein
MKKLILFITGIVCTGIIQTQAQTPPDHHLTGTVLSASDGTPLAGASISLKRSGIGAISDAKGHFSIILSITPDTLIISDIGFRRKQVIIKNPPVSPITLRLSPSRTQLEGVTVNTGYQQMPKERATGAFYFIDNKLLNRSV